MGVVSRRNLIGSKLALAGGLVFATHKGFAAGTPSATQPSPTPAANPPPKYGAGNTGLGISRALTEFTASIRFEDLSTQAVHEAKRALLDWLGCALIGSTHPTSQKLVKTLSRLGSAPTVRVIGHPGLKLSALDAPLANGQMGHILDFDDTHLGGVILHTSTATLPALLALGEQGQLDGKTLIVSLVAAFEAAIRVGQSMPSHHKGGWHLTGTLGSVASSIGAAKMLGLSAPHTLMALGIGCTQASGLQQNRGSDCKSLHAGKSAYHGVLAASLASDGYNSSSEILEGSLGFTRVYSTNQNLESITHELGKNWQINNNGYKPYSCGVVLHPLIDASIALSQKAQVGADDIAQFEILVHPDVIRITGVDQPGSGLMSKFSANHAAAVSFIDRAGGVNQFTNEKAQNSEVMGLRKLVNIVPSTHLELDQAQATLIKKSGEQVQVRIEHAKGTVQNPMSDEDIQGKFIQNASSCIGPAQIQQISNLVWRLEQLNDLNSLTSLLS